jgi:hypothetical protein
MRDIDFGRYLAKIYPEEQVGGWRGYLFDGENVQWVYRSYWYLSYNELVYRLTNIVRLWEKDHEVA